MNAPAIIRANGAEVSMTSLELVDFINEERAEQAKATGAPFPSKGFAKLGHDDFMRKVPEVLGEGVSEKFRTPYKHPQNGQQYECYRFPKREAILMAMSYSYTVQAKVYDHMTALEEKLTAPRFDLEQSLQIALDNLRLARAEEQRRIAAEAERDQAIATKAQIGSRREATAMATAAKATREAKQLRAALGFGTAHATVTAVEGATGREFGAQGWRPLKRHCAEHGLHPIEVPDKRYGHVQAWPAAAWHAVYGIDLGELFAVAEQVEP